MQEITVKYQTDTGTELILTPADIRRTICPAADDKEIELFLRLCESQRLNPFLREAYLIKYGTSPATMVIGKDVATKRAAKHPDCAGYQSGVVVTNEAGAMIHRDGTLTLAGEKLVGGWAKVWRKSWTQPYIRTVSMTEYAKPGGNWKIMPATMIAKIALVQALRDVFPEDLQGLYDADELTPGGSAELNRPAEVIETAQPAIHAAPAEPVIQHPTAEDVAGLTKFIKDCGVTRAQYLADMMANFHELVVMAPDGKPSNVDWKRCDMPTFEAVREHFQYSGTDFNPAPVQPDAPEIKF